MAVQHLTSKQVVLEKASRYSTVTIVPYMLFLSLEPFLNICDSRSTKKSLRETSCDTAFTFKLYF